MVNDIVDSITINLEIFVNTPKIFMGQTFVSMN